jgi:hypothetical protein
MLQKDKDRIENAFDDLELCLNYIEQISCLLPINMEDMTKDNFLTIRKRINNINALDITRLKLSVIEFKKFKKISDFLNQAMEQIKLTDELPEVVNNIIKATEDKLNDIV